MYTVLSYVYKMCTIFYGSVVLYILYDMIGVYVLAADHEFKKSGTTILIQECYIQGLAILTYSQWKIHFILQNITLLVPIFLYSCSHILTFDELASSRHSGSL